MNTQVNEKLAKVKGKLSTIKFDVFILLFATFQYPRQ